MAEKMFIHIAKKASFTSALQEKYNTSKSIVFIQDTQEIWNRGVYYAIPDTYKDKITSLESAQSALKYFTTIAGNTGTGSATAAGQTLNIKGDGTVIKTSVNSEGVTITYNGATTDTVTTVASSDKTVTVNPSGHDYDLSVKGNTATLGAAVSAATTDSALAAADTVNAAFGKVLKKIADVSTAAGSKVSSVTGENAINVTPTTGTPKVTLKINTASAGNVTLTQDTNGLKAAVDLSEYAKTSQISYPVTGVTTGDKVLKMTGTTVGATISMSYDSSAKKIKLFGTDTTTPISEVDCTTFIKDGMVQNAELVNKAESGVTDVEAPYIKITFNADGGNNVIRFSVKDLVDVYDGANLKLKSLPTTASYTAPANNDSVDTAVSKLAKGIEEAKTAATNAANAGVTKFGTKTGEITLKATSSTNGAVNLTMSNNELQAAVVGLKSAAYTESSVYATSTQGGYANSALQTVSASGTNYITASAATKTGNDGAKTQAISVSATIQTVANASASAKGLAEASDVKSYADGLLAWEEL